MNITLLGIDIAKNVFHLFGVNKAGEKILSKKLSREKLMEFVSQLPACEIVMEACGSANYWARTMKSIGHEVKLISPQYVKPFVKRNKNDERDAEAIVTAALNKQMSYVTPKTVEQQDMQGLLRVRENYIAMRTQVSNQLRGLMSEYGCIVKKGYSALRLVLPYWYDRDNENGLSPLMKQILEQQYQLLLEYEKAIKALDIGLKEISTQYEICGRLMEIEGIGLIGAVAIVSLVGDGSAFKNGRHFSAYVGLVPSQHSSGERKQLQGISKRGDVYLRQTLIHGARSVLIYAGKKEDSRSCWMTRLKERAGVNRAAVAVANKNARIAMAMILNGERYRKAS